MHIIFLHGFDSNLLEFRYLPAHFAGERVNVHYVDVLGWGLTDYPTDFEYTPSAKRAHVHAFVQKLIPRDAHVYLAGASLGGAVAIDYVLQHPDFVKGLILIDAQAYMDRPKSFMSALPFVAELGSEVLRSTWLRKQGINMSYQSKGLRESDDVLRIGSLHCRQPGWKEATASFVRNEGYILSQRVKEIQIPTIVLWGEYDRVLPIAHAERFQRDLRDGRLVWVRDSGHSPHIEQGEIVAGEIIEFVTEVERRTMDTGVQQRLHETQSLPKH